MILNSSCILESSRAAFSLLMLSLTPDQMNLYLWGWSLGIYIFFKSSLGDYETMIIGTTDIRVLKVMVRCLNFNGKQLKAFKQRKVRRI